jgi:hypothetical protein
MLEEYLMVQGREWERFAWLKGRTVSSPVFATPAQFDAQCGRSMRWAPVCVSQVSRPARSPRAGACAIRARPAGAMPDVNGAPKA